MTRSFAALALFALALVLSAPGPALAQAQGTGVEFRGLRQDPGQPVEVTADSLTVNQTDGSALFEGNVVATQGDLRLAAATVQVDYDEDGGVSRLTAQGGVTLASATDAAEAREAVYEVLTGTITMAGDVLLTQGRATITGQRLVLNLDSGTGRMEGRVQTVFAPGTGTVRN